MTICATKTAVNSPNNSHCSHVACVNASVIKCSIVSEQKKCRIVHTIAIIYKGTTKIATCLQKIFISYQQRMRCFFAKKRVSLQKFIVCV